METTENNKLIAEFMGEEINGATCIIDGKLTKIGKHPSELKYHTSWDWLMFAFQKCYNMPYYGYKSKKFNWIFIGLGHPFEIFTQKQRVYDCVVEFIKWYNENKED